MTVVGTRTLPRESAELVRPTIEVDGVDQSATIAYQVTAVPDGQRPTTWTDPTGTGSMRGYLTGTLTEGTYDLWVQIVDSPERIVERYARLKIT